MISFIKTAVVSVLLAACTCAHAQKNAANEYRERMAALSRQYDAAPDGASRSKALRAMESLDMQYKADASGQIKKNFNTKEATLPDYRRAAMALAAAGDEAGAMTYFRRGADLGEPHCANQVLLYELAVKQNPEAVFDIAPKCKSFNLALSHNIALALLVMGNPAGRKIAEGFFTEFDSDFGDSSISFDSSEFIDYNPDGKTGARWVRTADRSAIGRTLRKYASAR